MSVAVNNPATVRLIKSTLQSEYAKNYLDSAPFFKAIIETPPKNGYFVESSQFEDTHGYKAKREYKLKCVGNWDNQKVASNISKVLEFSSKHKADTFFNEMEFTPTKALVINRYLITRQAFDDLTTRFERIYDNGYTALYVSPHWNKIVSYCEGDFVEYHALNDDIFEAEIKRHHDFYLENEA